MAAGVYAAGVDPSGSGVVPSPRVIFSPTGIVVDVAPPDPQSLQLPEPDPSVAVGCVPAVSAAAGVVKTTTVLLPAGVGVVASGTVIVVSSGRSDWVVDVGFGVGETSDTTDPPLPPSPLVSSSGET